MTDDDTKFERARREAPHIEAFVQVTTMGCPTTMAYSPRPPRTLAEMLEDWARHDEQTGTPPAPL